MAQDDVHPRRIGRYEIVRTIGRGAMGEIFEAQDPALGRPVAIKLLGGAAVGHDEALLRFRDEARAVARLQHPNIVAVHDFGEQDGAAYIVMEIVRGGSLGQWLERHGPMPVPEAVQTMGQLLSALDYAHALGIVHRDVKPGNLLLDDRGGIRLGDFGLARVDMATDRTLAGTVLGTPRYMAPEQVRGEPVGPTADIYAAGALFYEILTGRPVFTGSMVEVMHAVLATTPEPPSRVGPASLPPVFDAVILRALEKRPEARYASASEFAYAIKDAQRSVALGEELAAAFVNGVPTAARPSLFQRVAGALGAWRGRHREEPAGLPVPPVPPVPPASRPAPEDRPAGSHAVASPAVAPRPAPAPEPPDTGRTVIWKPTVVPAEAAAAATTAPPADAGDRSILLPPPMAARPPVSLIVTASTDRRLVGRSVAIQSDDFVLGRDPAADFVVADDRCSRHHARIRFEDGRFVVADLGSSNGTWLDGRPLKTPRTLLFGASIGIGETILTFAHAHDTTLPDLAGQLVAGRYRLVRCMREGPKGSIYEAAPTGVGANVAVKLLSADLAAYPGYRERFEGQAHAAAKLQHPHVARLLDYGVAELRAGDRPLQTPFLCYELFGGGSLSARMAQPAPIELELALRWVGQIGDALGHAHRRAIVHGDLKPTSVCLDAEANAYVMDFVGADHGGEAGAAVIGAPAFIAPEQWQGEAATEATDQFALAVLAYLLLSGGRPFVGQESPAMRERNFQRPPRPAHEEARDNGREGVTSAASAVLQRALAVNPGERHESVGRFTAELAAALRPGRRGAEALVFVSYRHEPSAGWAVLLARELKEKHQLGVFVDTQRLDGAMQFPAKLQRAIERCEVFVCLLADSTLASPWVREEIRLAHRFGRPMIPVFQESFAPLEPGAMEPAIEALLHFDGVHLLDRRNIHIDHTIEDLARLVQGTLQRPAR
jgi:serine/threonine protein kinase/pSer/pThr/pTyr-binding forkhead associated (FHA) protein